MNTKRIFTSKRSFTLYFMAFLEDHQSLDAFVRRTGFESIEEYCSHFYNWMTLDGDIRFEDAARIGFLFKSSESPRWYRLSQDWVKFVHSK